MPGALIRCMIVEQKVKRTENTLRNNLLIKSKVPIYNYSKIRTTKEDEEMKK